MTQKKINDILYVFEDTAYEITKDTDATVIYVQEELVDDYISVNESLAAKIKPYNYKVAVVHELEWMPYINSGQQDPELAWSANFCIATIGGTNTYPTLSNPHDVDIVYSSSDEERATIDTETGEITLVSAGETTIKAYFEGNDDYESAEVTYTLLVVAPSPELSWSENRYEAIIGGTNEFPTLSNPHSVDVEYFSSTEDFATIDSETGEITLIAAGNLQIGARNMSDGYAPQEVIYVLNVREAAELSWSAASATVDLQDPSATYPTLSNPHSASIAYSTSDQTIATVDWMTGQVTPLQTGTVEIWAFAFNDPTYSGGAKYDLTITDTPVYNSGQILSHYDIIIEDGEGNQDTLQADYHFDNAVEGETYKVAYANDQGYYTITPFNLSTGEYIAIESCQIEYNGQTYYGSQFTMPESGVLIFQDYDITVGYMTFDDQANIGNQNVFYMCGEWFEIAPGATRALPDDGMKISVDQREDAPAYGKIVSMDGEPVSATGGDLGNGAWFTPGSGDYTITISDPVSEP